MTLSTILIAEDSRTQALQLQALLEGRHYHVVLADNGQKALKWLMVNKPALVITDIMMPEMNGYELCREIKSQTATRNIPVILLTSLNDPYEVIEGLEAGADSFITKPYDAEYLLLHVEKIMTEDEGKEAEKKSFGVEINFRGKKRIIQAEQQQIIKLLLNIYEGAIQQNAKLIEAEEKLSALNDNLESLVEERTTELMTKIDERLAAEKELIKSETKFRTIFDESPIGIELYDAKGIQVTANKASLDIFGIHDESSAGFNLFEGTSLNENIISRLRQGESVVYQANFDFDKVRKLGQYSTSRTGTGEMEYFITPLKVNGEGDLSGYLLQVKEITEQKKAEKIRQVLYNISSAVVTTRDTAELIGIIREELGRLVDTTNFYVAFYNEITGMLNTPYLQDESDDMMSWPAAKSLTGYAIRQARPVLITDKEFPELISNGTIEMIGVPSACWLGVPLHIDGKVIGAFVVQSYDNPGAYSVKDMEILEFVSDQISLAVQRKQAEAELIKATENAQESDRLKSAFLANMSHEIRTPMNAIVGFAGMLSDPDVSPEERNRFSRIIQSRSDDLMHIINDLLEISRIESGNAIVVKSTISMNAVLDEMETVFRQKLSKGNKVHLSISTEKAWPDNRCEIMTDGYILRQVFSNLIDNAIKYTNKGSIRFGYREPENGVVGFYVSDTGVGIAPENQKVIFEHFRQADTPDQHKYGGTGLGLSICKGSLALLGGTIRVESEPGKGSTFHFTLPYEVPVSSIRNPVSVPNQGPTSVPAYNWSGKTLLLVEDEETNMDFLRIILKSTRANLLFATSGAELRKYYEQLGSIDLILLDIRLPDANGWDLTAEIKALRPGLTVIAQTAFAMSVDRRKSLDAGCDNYISKPIGKNVLLEMLAGYLDGGPMQ